MTPACADQELLLNAFIDGELDAAHCARLEDHLAECPECRSALDDLCATHAALAGPGVRYALPPGLEDNVRKSVRDHSAGPRPSARTLSWLGPAVGGAIAASVALVAIAPLRQQTAMEDQLVAGHVRSLQVEHLTDVQTSNQHLIRPWFNGKIDFAPPVPELARAGFPLAGGRLDYMDGRTVAAIVYRRRLHAINLFVWPDANRPDRQFEKDGYAVAERSQNGLRYAAVSDIPAGDLSQFRQAFVRATART
jgi:anti-sigma factor RsiW